MPGPDDMIAALINKDAPPQPQFHYGYPSPDDVAFARANDATYGTRAAGIDTPGYKIGNSDMRLVADVANLPASNKSFDLPNFSLHSTPPDFVKDKIYAAYLASLHSPVAALGFDPGRINSSWPQTHNLSIGGMYSPAVDETWFDPRNASSIEHEFTHRGINQLRRAGDPSAPTAGLSEELMVRALMQKHFADAEALDSVKKAGMTINDIDPTSAGYKQFMAGKEMLKKYPKDIDALENAATKLYHQKDHAMGPR